MANPKITYTEIYGILYPDLKLEDTTNYHIGRYGRLREEFNETNNVAMWHELSRNGFLNEYLYEIDTKAGEYKDGLIEQMAEAQYVTEKLKSENQMEWVGRMNNICHSAHEIVLHDLIYN